MGNLACFGYSQNLARRQPADDAHTRKARKVRPGAEEKGGVTGKGRRGRAAGARGRAALRVGTPLPAA